jgi:hypothetical protein
MIRKLLIVAVSGVLLALISIGAAVAIGGPSLRGAMHDGSFVWDSDKYKGPVVKKELVFDASRTLEMSLPVDMHFVRGDKVSMIVEGPKRAIDELVYEDGRLELRGPRSGRPNDGIKLTITAPTLPTLDISGPANIEIQDLRQPEFNLSMAGAGNIEASGKVQKLVIDASGAGNVDLSKLETVDAEVDIAGLGNADINASGKVTASIAGAGNVTLHRKPRRLESDIAGLGNVEHAY